MKKIMALVICVAALLSLGSCNFNFRGGGDTNSGAIYGKGVSTSVVIPDGSNIDGWAIEGEIFDITGVLPRVITDSQEKSGAEIVLGDTTRPISALAKEELEKRLKLAIRENPDEDLAKKELVGFTVYGSGNSVAVVFSHEEIIDHAIDYFIDKYMDKESLTLAEGHAKTEIFSITDFRKDQEEVLKEAAWDKLYDDFIKAGATEDEAEAAVRNTKNHYKLFDESIYLWLANLYDSSEGGFYYSNSARDTVGFLPDIESTFQAINYLCNTGFLNEAGATNDERVDALPEEMKEKIINFFLSRQSSADGYFKHPQWPSVEIARLGRDLNWATSMLSWFDTQPLYTTPTGVQGSLGAPTGVAPTSITTVRLGGTSVATAASKVMAASEVYPEQLQTLEAFEEYLDNCDLENDSYYWGHILSAQATLISARGPEFVEAYEKHFNAACRPDNGLWEEKVGYDSTNGLMKIIATYNSLEIEFPYPEQAINSAIKVAVLENEDEWGRVPNHACDVYNVFYAIDDVLKNVQKFGDEAIVKEFREMVIHQAPDIISKATVKAATFKQPDGGYAYNQWGANPTSQGCPVAVPGLPEGDVNGNSVATNGIIGNLYGMLGIANPRIYYRSDLIRFIEEIESLGAVVKNTAEMEAEVVTFDDEPIGTREPIALETCNAGMGKAEVVTRPAQNDPNDHALLFTDESTQGGSNSDMKILPGGIVYGQTRNVFEFDILVESANEADPTFQCWIGDSYMFLLKVKNGRVNVVDISGSSGEGVIVTELDVSFPLNEWHTLRFEVYQGDHENSRIKVFLDGYLRAVSNNYYGKREGAVGTPNMAYPFARIYSLSDTKVVAYLDNVFASKDSVMYEEEPVVNPNRLKDFEAGEIGSSKLPNEVSGQCGGEGSVRIEADPKNADNKVLHYKSDGGDYVYFPATSNDLNEKNCFALELDIYPVAASTAQYLNQIYFQTESGTLMGYTFKKVAVNGKDHLALLGYSPAGLTAPLAYIPFGEWTNLRIEYYRNQYTKPEDSKAWTAVKNAIYLNGERVEHMEDDLLPYFDLNVLSKEVLSLNVYTMNGLSFECYFDDVIFEKIYKEYKDVDGKVIPDPENPEYPLGGQGSNVPAEKDHDGIFDFDNEEYGIPAIPGLITDPNSKEYGNDMEISDDPLSETVGDNALHVTTKSGNDWNTIYFYGSKVNPAGADCSVVEMDMYIVSGMNEDGMQIFFKDKYDVTILTLTMYYRTTGSARIDIYSPTGTVSVPLKESLNLRFEYYAALGIIQVYSGTELCGELTGAPNTAPVNMMFACLSKSNFDLYLDNVKVYAENKTYKAS